MIIGWDVSTSFIGICASLPDGTFRYRVIEVKGETMLEKYRYAESSISLFLAGIKAEFEEPRVHIVEDRLGNFSQGKTMQQTLMKLAQMNAVVSHFLDLDGQVIHVHPSRAKSLAGLKVPKGGDKKAEAIKLVRSRDGSFPYTQTKAGNPKAGVADMADAWLLTIAGTKILGGEAELGQAKEARRGDRKARRTTPKIPGEG